MSEYEQKLTAIAHKYRMSLDAMLEPCRRRDRVLARVEAYQYLRERGWSYPQIGAYFHRDHTTILWALGKTQKARRARETKTRLQQYAEQQR